MAVLSEGNRLNDVLKDEQQSPAYFSRETITVESGEDLSLGAVLGRKELTIPTTGTADGENTGAGTCTGVAGGSKTKKGTYTLICIEESAGAGVFQVTDPDGYVLPPAAVAVAYSHDQIEFTLNDGDPDFALGDQFTITVAEGSLEVVAIDFSAVDGSQNAYGIAAAAYDATAAAVKGVAIARNASIVAENLVWPDGASAGQKTAALAQLAAKGIKTVKEV